MKNIFCRIFVKTLQVFGKPVTIIYFRVQKQMKINMKTIFSTLLFLGVILTGLFGQESDLQQLKIDVVYLSSDYLEGRETAKKGEQLAGEYIAHRFQALGLQPKGDDGSFYHHFDFKQNDNPHATSGGEDKVGRNVVAYLDNGAAHTVVIGAHYDHLGMGGFGSLYTGAPAIHKVQMIMPVG